MFYIKVMAEKRKGGVCENSSLVSSCTYLFFCSYKYILISEPSQNSKLHYSILGDLLVDTHDICIIFIMLCWFDMIMCYSVTLYLCLGLSICFGTEFSKRKQNLCVHLSYLGAFFCESMFDASILLIKVHLNF